MHAEDNVLKLAVSSCGAFTSQITTVNGHETQDTGKPFTIVRNILDLPAALDVLEFNAGFADRKIWCAGTYTVLYAYESFCCALVGRHSLIV